MGSNKSLPLSTWLLITLLSVIAVMLIVPEIDAPDTALQLNTAPQVVHGVVHHVPQGNLQFPASVIEVELFEKTDLAYKFQSSESDSSLSLVSHQILRC